MTECEDCESEIPCPICEGAEFKETYLMGGVSIEEASEKLLKSYKGYVTKEDRRHLIFGIRSALMGLGITEEKIIANEIK